MCAFSYISFSQTLQIFEISPAVLNFYTAWQRDLKNESDGREEAEMAELHTDPGAGMKIFPCDFIAGKCSRSPQFEIHAGSFSFGSFSNSLP